MERQPIFYPLENVPQDIKKRVAFYLDQPTKPNWRSLIVQMPSGMYTPSKIEEFSAQTLKPNGSPTLALLADLEKRQVPLMKVVEWLKSLSMDCQTTYRVLGLLIPLLGDSFGVPQITVQPQDEVVFPGMAVSLYCECTGQAPLQYQWFKGKLLLQGQTTNRLLIPSANEIHQGNYVCRVSNVIACTFTEWAKVLVVHRQISNDLNKPVIIMHPKSLDVYTGDELKLYCDAVGNPSPHFQWYFNHNVIKGALDREYVIKAAESQHTGLYHCEASNDYGTVRSLAAVVNISEVTKVSVEKQYEGRGPDTFQPSEVTSPWVKKPTSKLALLIGNQEYTHSSQLGELVHPRNDVRDIAGILTSIGFRVVTLVDLTLAEMQEALHNFCKILEKDMYTVFYFAGHGFEVHSESFLMPIDATSEYDPNGSMSVSDVLAAISGRQAKLNLLLLDCCRTTPKACTVDPIPKLTEKLDVKQTNTVVGFGCCSQARVLECPSEANGFFAAELVKHLGKRKKIDDVLFEVAKGIHRAKITDPATGQRQIVYRLSTLVEELSLCDEPLHNYMSEGLTLWEEAHQIPASPVTVFKNDYVQVDLSLVPEFSNVLLIHSVLTTHVVSRCSVHFLVPSKVGGAKVQVLQTQKGRKLPEGETIRISSLQGFLGELDIHVEVNYHLNGMTQRGRAVYCLQEKPLYARIVGA